MKGIACAHAGTHLWLAAILPVVIAGCSLSGKSTSGGGSTGSSATGSATGSSGSSATGTPIPIGIIASSSGSQAASIGKVPDVAQAWASTVNANGGIDGHPVKLYIEDDADDPVKLVAR